MEERELKIQDGFIGCPMRDIYAVIPTSEKEKTFNNCITMNKTGGFMWCKLAEGTTMSELVSAVCKEYNFTTEEDKAMVAKDVGEYVAELDSWGILI